MEAEAREIAIDIAGSHKCEDESCTLVARIEDALEAYAHSKVCEALESAAQVADSFCEKICGEECEYMQVAKAIRTLIPEARA